MELRRHDGNCEANNLKQTGIKKRRIIMTPQIQKLIDAGYVTRKQAAAILGRGDGSNIVVLCKHGGVRAVQIPFGKKTTTLFLERDVTRLAEKMSKKNGPKIVKEGNKVRGGTIAVDGEARVPIQCELPVAKEVFRGRIATKPTLRDVFPEAKRMILMSESDIMNTLGRIEAMLTALLGRKDIK